MKTIYLAVMAQIKAEVPQIKWIDLDTGQLDSQARPAVAFPCALVGISITPKANLTDTIQDCRATITVRLAMDNKGNTSGITPDVEIEKSLAVYDTIADVYKALQGFSTDNFDSLTRIKQGREKSRHGLFQYRFDFSTEFEDDTAEG